MSPRRMLLAAAVAGLAGLAAPAFAEPELGQPAPPFKAMDDHGKPVSLSQFAGKTVVLKDNVSLAGVPMMNGASTLEGFVPTMDATVVTRLLDAGATIVGKATCEYFCLSGGSHTSEPGPVHNPRKMGYSAGGSSSGSAALVATHNERIAAKMDRVVRLHEGRLEPAL